MPRDHQNFVALNAYGYKSASDTEFEFNVHVSRAVPYSIPKIFLENRVWPWSHVNTQQSYALS